MSGSAIADYALLSDRHTAALVNREGSVDWLCFPRFDSPSIFGRLLDEDAGHWRIGPADDAHVTRRYVDQTMVLQTIFRTHDGVLVLSDALLTGADDGGHRLGVDVPHVLAREVRCTEGAVLVRVEYDPRPEYGLVSPRLSWSDGGIASQGGSARMVLTTPVRLEPGPRGLHGEVLLTAGDTLRFGLHWSSLDRSQPRVWSQRELAARLGGTVLAWRSWSSLHQAYDGPARDLVHHSGRVLQALSFQPTGAIVAAPTTSLPEWPGGERTWDYRYSWVRDASLTLQALWVAACPDEARQFFDFVTAAASSSGRDRGLQIMFGVGGERDLSERELPHLSGWRDSRPVRVGNGAWNQRQLDVYGAILAAVRRLADQLHALDESTRKFLRGCADAAAEQWTEKDHGIWEIRGEPRHFLHSKVMCWSALDCALGLTGLLRPDSTTLDRWRRVRDQIRRAVLRDGWNADVGAFTQSFGSDELDASVLTMPITGIVSADDPRMLATIDAIEERLTDDRGLVYRYRAGVDGLPGGEGSFVLCTFWLAHALALAGRVQRAGEVFERAAALGNDVGLFAEQAHPVTGEALGNFPQAFSHIGLVDAAWALHQAANLADHTAGR